uniref:Uncharacterized protein n=1 Tax=Quercus lobata TaxID=97700 RepID=A0A7N2MCQ0_QUELO
MFIREEVKGRTFSVPLKLSYMADQKSSVVIPTGYILKNEVQKDRSKLSSSLIDLGRKGDHFTSLDGLHSDTDSNVLEWPLVSSGIPFVNKSLEILSFSNRSGARCNTKLDLVRLVGTEKLKAKKIVKNARRTHLLIKKARGKRLSGQSSRSLAIKRSEVLSAWRKRLPGQSSKLPVVDQGKEIIDLGQSTGPKGSIDLGESTKADSLPHQAMLEVEQVANLESSDLVSAN